MRKELVIKGRSLTGTSDLTLLAPITPGLVPSLDSMTYKSRVKRLLRTLQGGRASMHEYAAYRPIADAVERVAAIHSFRVCVLEPEDKVLLAVTFDGTWESYIRILWQKVGTLLDIIFCNTEGYVLSTASFEEWTGWVHRVQVETSFFYNTHGLTVDDVAYLREEERIHRSPGNPGSHDLQATRHHVQSAESIAWDASQTKTPESLDALRQGLQSLAVLFRLTDVHLPGTPDGDILLRAARDLLQEFALLAYSTRLPADIAEPMKKRFERQLAWLNSMPAFERQLPAFPTANVRSEAFPFVQAGILWPIADVTHGCLVMIAVDDRAAAAALLDELIAMTTTEAGKPQMPGLVVNVALTYEGLRAFGMSEAQLEFFPQEFREGMEARASMLGDFRTNHPRHWRLPVRNWNVPSGAATPQIELSAVHLVVQLRTHSNSSAIDPTQPTHPLYPTIKALENGAGSSTPRRGIRLLTVEGMYRMFNAKQQPQEHFGFADGGSDPVFDLADQGNTYRNRVHTGEFLLGRDNEVDPARPPASAWDRERDDWLRDGSFLVVRKLAQHVDALHNTLLRASKETGLARDTLLSKMMGRAQDGTPLADPGAVGNDFNYVADANGARCPFHAHIRRANPRTPDADQVDDGPTMPLGGRHPRLMRRSMPYGPPYSLLDPGKPATPDGAERGLMFMAYNASISEQFEVIQRWISGGNSAGGHSRQSDPFLGVPDWNESRTYRFEEGGVAHRIELDSAPQVSEAAKPLVKLEWGMYLFTPSIPALKKLRNVAAAGLPQRAPWSVDEGELAVQALLEVEREQGEHAAIQGWKALLEDAESEEKFRSAGAWAAIRAHHGGVLRTAFGVLVAEPSLIMQVLGSPDGAYSVSGYRDRMLTSIGETFLGLDAGTDGEYERQSRDADLAISSITENEAFDLAMQYTQEALRGFVDAEIEVTQRRQLPTWELNLDAKEVVDKVLARLCQEWFGLPDDPAGTILVPGSWRWDWEDGEPPIYPAHFTAPSRYIFQPNPGLEVEEYGRRIGAALTAAILRFIAPYRAKPKAFPQTPGPVPKDARIAKAILEAFPEPEADALTARIFSGALMGFLPTVDGNFRLSLNELLRDGSFWSLRAAWLDRQGGSAFTHANTMLKGPMARAMQFRPSPELVWRRAARDGLRLGQVEINAGDMVVASLVSATHQNLETGKPDISIIFGGARKPTGPHPTHACPGYRAGMGVLLGMLAAFMDIPHTLRPSPVALAFTFEGATPPIPTGEQNGKQ